MKGLVNQGKPEQSKTVTPDAAGFTVSPDTGKTLSSVVVNGDSDLVATNIKGGVNIFGVTGNLTGGYEYATGTLNFGTTVVKSKTFSVGFKPTIFIFTAISDGAYCSGGSSIDSLITYAAPVEFNHDVDSATYSMGATTCTVTVTSNLFTNAIARWVALKPA